MEWISQDFQGQHFDNQAVNETSSSWGLTRRNVSVSFATVKSFYVHNLLK